MNDSDRQPLKLRFLGSLVEQLGAQLYPGATATIAELISNAWDADAQHVWIDIPLDRPWKESDRIVVTDDGVGMSHDDAATRYLMVGRKRRVELDQDKSAGGRPLHGRKGIGKLAAFGTARILECHTVDKGGEPTRFRLDYDHIRSLKPTEDYDVEEAKAKRPLVDPTGATLHHGTRITLSALLPRRALNGDQFRRSLARRFALDAAAMQILVNGSRVGRFDHKLSVRFPRDSQLFDSDVKVKSDGWATMTLQSRPIRWWIGFSEKPLEEKDLQGVSVLAHGKMVQRPFFFQRTAGTQGQLGQEYLIGEVEADWLDDGKDIDTDLIQANRDQLQLEDERLADFLEWGQELIRLALRKWSDLRQEQITKGVDTDSFTDLLERLTAQERERLRRVVLAISRIPAIDPIEARDLVSAVVDAHEDTIIRELLESIDDIAPDSQTAMWDIVRRFGLIDARRNQTLIEARLKAIAELRRFVDKGEPEVPTIHEHIKDNPWLLDPRWYLLDDEVPLSDLGIDPNEEERGGRMDFLFALGPSTPYTHDELLVVEIKRGTNKSGSVRRADRDEVNRFHDYVLAAHDSRGQALRVTGLMIAQEYTATALRVRKSLESGQEVRLVFRTWDQVLQETERLHKGWLAVTTRRATEGSED